MSLAPGLVDCSHLFGCTTTLDGGPLVAQSGADFCCLLCQRQFQADKKLRKHLAKSELHAGNLEAAVVAGRVTDVAKQRPLGEEGDAGSRKRERAADGAGEGPAPRAESSGAMSAMEQMELFERRLKSQAKVAPASKPKREIEAEVDSNRARTINNQMDWECSECNEFNFARVVVCHRCKRHVDSSTKYLSNRLKELKKERYARIQGGSTPGFVQDPVREHALNRAAAAGEGERHDGSGTCADGSCARPADTAEGRAAFSQ